MLATPKDSGKRLALCKSSFYPKLNEVAILRPASEAFATVFLGEITFGLLPELLTCQKIKQIIHV